MWPFAGTIEIGIALVGMDSAVASMARPAKTHDYGPGTRGWGHDYTWEPEPGGLRGTAIGHGAGISNGDYILLERHDNNSGRLLSDGRTRYRVVSIEYYADPTDMWQATLEFAPR